MPRLGIAFVAASVGLLTGCAPVSPSVQPAGGTMPAAQLSNPASVRCVEQGGSLAMERRPDGGQYGVCTFTDNRQCEEWAMFRGECPVGGLRVAGYLTAASRYCAISGGRYTEPGSCALPGGKTCNAEAYFAGTCSRQ